MKKVNNLDELVELIGMETVEKCFMEYIMLMIAKAKRFDSTNVKSEENILDEEE